MYYAEYDENSNYYCVFHTDIKPDHAYASFASMEEAERVAEKMNDDNKETVVENETDKKFNCIEEALNGLKKFQTYRLEAKDQEREILTDALIEAEIQPWQITSLIEALQKKL